MRSSGPLDILLSVGDYGRMKATAIACALLLAAALAPADDSTDLAGEWEVQILLEVDPEVISAEEPGDLAYRETFVIAFSPGGRALISPEAGNPQEVSWEERGNLFVLTYPDDGDFQYTAFYHFSVVDFGTLVFVLHDIFGSRVGIMSRTE
jgi:hypothetical protein